MTLNRSEILIEEANAVKDYNKASNRNFRGFICGLMAGAAGLTTTLASARYIHNYTAPVKREESFVTGESLVFAGGLTLSALVFVGAGYRYVARQNRDESCYRSRLVDLAMESTTLK